MENSQKLLYRKIERQDQRVFDRVLLLLVSVLVIAYTPTLISAECLGASGLQWHFNAAAVNEDTPDTQVIVGEFKFLDENGQDICPHSALSGSLVKYVDDNGLEAYDVGISTHLNAILDGCPPFITLAATVDADQTGSGALLIWDVEEGTFIPFQVELEPCDTATEPSATNAEQPWLHYFR